MLINYLQNQPKQKLVVITGQLFAPIVTVDVNHGARHNAIFSFTALPMQVITGLLSIPTIRGNLFR